MIALQRPTIDYKNPDYARLFNARLAFAKYMRETPGVIQYLKDHYRENPADFICDWGVTFEPRNADLRLPTIIPFVLFDKQREWIDTVLRKWRAREPLLTEKSRDCGISYCAVDLSATLCIFHEGLAIGFGSRKEEYVDKAGQPKSLFWKARLFMENLPEEFRASWLPWRDAPHMRINFPATGSVMTGEAGDQIGRGDRTTIHFLDESAYLERPELVDQALSQTTNCRIDVSSVRGMNNPFAKKRHEGKIEVFVFDWRDDPRKDEAWYQKQCDELDPVTVAQEIDRDYLASVGGVVIPGIWVRSALDAFEKLGIKPRGQRRLALDVADEGVDKNALVGSTGNEIDFLREFSGKGSDIYATTAAAFEVCDAFGYPGFRYDADGIGASVRGDARVINEARAGTSARQYQVVGFRGSAKVVNPEGVVEGTIGSAGDKGRLNEDYFMNLKAQQWWSLRNMFRRTYRWVVEGHPCDPDTIISISTKAPEAKALVHKLTTELSQPTYSINLKGKIVINKQPDGMKSPNLGDGAMINFADMGPTMNITPDVINELRLAGLRASGGRHARRYQGR